MPKRGEQQGRFEMKNWKNGTIARGVQEFVGVPTGGESARFRFAIANNTGDDQLGIVERGPIGVDQ